jgi:hypothetical protein
MEQQKNNTNKNVFTWNSKRRTRTRMYSHGTAKEKHEQEYIHMEQQKKNKNKNVFTWNSKRRTRTRMYSHVTAKEQHEQEYIHMEQQKKNKNKNVFTWNSKRRTITRMCSHGTAKEEQECIQMEQPTSLFLEQTSTWASRFCTNHNSISTLKANYPLKLFHISLQSDCMNSSELMATCNTQHHL